MAGKLYRSPQTYRSHDTYRGSDASVVFESYFLPPVVEITPNALKLAQRGISIPSRRYLSFLRTQTGEDLDGQGGITIGGIHYWGGRWNGPLAVAEVAAITDAGYDNRIVQAASPGDLPADIALGTPGGGGGGGTVEFNCNGVGVEWRQGVDQYAELVAALDSVPDGGEFCLEPQKIYLCRGSFLAHGLSDVIIHGNGADVHTDIPVPVVNNPSRGDPRFVAKGCDQLQVRNLFVSGVDGQRFDSHKEHQHGFLSQGSVDTLIEGGGVHDVGGDVLGAAWDKENGNFPDTRTHATGLDSDRIGRHVVCCGSSVIGLEFDHATTGAVGRSFADFELDFDNAVLDTLNIHDHTLGSFVNQFLGGQGRGEHFNITLQDIECGTDIRTKVGKLSGVRVRHNYRLIRCKGLSPYMGGSSTLLQFIETDGLIVDDCDQPMNQNPLKNPSTYFIGGIDQGIGSTPVEASGNRSSRALALFPPGPPPAGCTWTDGGGNDISP